MSFPFIKYLYTFQNTAADKQQCDPEDHIAVVTGFRAFCASARVGLRRIDRFCCEAGSRNLNCCLLVATNLALLMLRALLRCGRFLVNNPLEVVHRLIGLIATGALMPVVRSIVLPLAAVAVSMFTAAGCRNRFGCHRITADGAFLML